MPDARVGGAYYEVRVDSSQVRSDMASTESAVTDSVGKQISAFTSLIGKTAAVVGAIAATAKAVSHLRMLFDGLADGVNAGTKSFNSFADSIEDKNAKEQLASLEKQIESLSNRIADFNNPLNGLFDFATTGRTFASLEKEYDLLLQKRALQSERNNDEINKKQQEAIDKAAKEESSKRVDRLAKEEQDIREQQTRIARIRAEANGSDPKQVEVDTQRLELLRQLGDDRLSNRRRALAEEELAALYSLQNKLDADAQSEASKKRMESIKKEHDERMRLIGEEIDARLRGEQEILQLQRDQTSSNISVFTGITTAVQALRRDVRAIKTTSGFGG